jgi:hypothetical protein
MGVPNLNDGSIERADIDGRNRKTIVPEGGPSRRQALVRRNRGRCRAWAHLLDPEGARRIEAALARPFLG